jgi:hypothetical protein
MAEKHPQRKPTEVDFVPQVYQPQQDESEKRLVPSQQDLRFMIDIEKDVPERVRDVLWGMESKHLSLTNIDGKSFDILDYQREVRRIARVARWTRATQHMNAVDIEQAQFFATHILAPKAIDRGERQLASTIIQRTQFEQSGEMSPAVTERQSSISKLKSMLGIGGGGNK